MFNRALKLRNVETRGDIVHYSPTLLQNYALPCQDATHQNHFSGNIRSHYLLYSCGDIEAKRALP